LIVETVKDVIAGYNSRPEHLAYTGPVRQNCVQVRQNQLLDCSSINQSASVSSSKSHYFQSISKSGSNDDAPFNALFETLLLPMRKSASFADVAQAQSSASNARSTTCPGKPLHNEGTSVLTADSERLIARLSAGAETWTCDAFSPPRSTKDTSE
jgi:hypothetical protein